MAEDYLISVIVPAYNSAAYIEQCIQSLLSQTDPHFEIIVVNDGSTDGTASICSEYASDPRLKIIEQPNAGPGAARNNALDRAEGQFVTFVDSDDFVSDDYLSTLRAKQIATASDIVSARFAWVDETGHFSAGQTSHIRPKMTVRGTEIVLGPAEQVLGGFAAGIACARLYRATMLRANNLRFPTSVRHEDLFFTYKAFLCAGRTAHLAMSTYFYRRHAGGSMQNLMDSRVDAIFKLEEDTSAFLATLGLGDLYKALSNRRTLVVASNLYAMASSSPADVYAAFNRRLATYRDALKDMSAQVTSTLGDESLSQETRSFVASLDNECAGDSDIVDLLVIPHKDYHVWTFSLISDAVAKHGLRYQIVDISNVYRDEGMTAKAAELGIPVIPFSIEAIAKAQPRMLLTFNDWEPVTRAVFHAASAANVQTAAIVEGIQDYQDSDTSRSREPYRNSDLVFVPGQFDAKFFTNERQTIKVSGVPRIAKLASMEASPPRPSGPPRVLINSNFSYGVLEAKRDEWLTAAVDAVLRKGMLPIVSRHPADRGTLFQQYETHESFYDVLETCDLTIQRFASGILEALARRKPVVYFNPHGEKVDKFQNPMGAYWVCNDVSSLDNVLSRNPSEWWLGDDEARLFLDVHCAISEPNMAEVIADGLAERLSETSRSAINYNLLVEKLRQIQVASRDFTATPPLQRLFPAIYGRANWPRTAVLKNFEAIATQDVPTSSVRKSRPFQQNRTQPSSLTAFARRLLVAIGQAARRRPLLLVPYLALAVLVVAISFTVPWNISALLFSALVLAIGLLAPLVLVATGLRSKSSMEQRLRLIERKVSIVERSMTGLRDAVVAHEANTDHYRYAIKSVRDEIAQIRKTGDGHIGPPR